MTGWKLTEKGKQVMKEAHRLLPEAAIAVYSDKYSYTLHVASGGSPNPPKWLKDYEVVVRKKRGKG